MSHTISPCLGAAIRDVAFSVIAHADELGELDRAIGDGDHGVNMRRGAEAVLAVVEQLAELPPPAVMQLLGAILVTTIGGAPGPLYGTFFRRLGDALAEARPGTGIADAVSAAVRAVESRGRSRAGEKTLLDVLVPIERALWQHHDEPDLLQCLRRVAEEAATATIPMAASKGRAAYLGARSVGHMDPGARSSWLIVETLCRTLEGYV